MSLQEREKIYDVIKRYSWAVDRRDWEELRKVFVPDAVWEYTPIGSPTGIDTIIETIQQALKPLDKTQHLVAGSLIEELSENEAKASTQLHAQHTRYGHPNGENYVIAGDYLDRLVRTEDGWKLAHRKIEVRWTSGNPDIFND